MKDALSYAALIVAERRKTLREIGLVLYHEANGKLWFMCRSYYDELAAAGQLTEGGALQ